MITSKASKWLNGLPWFIPPSLLLLVATVVLAAFSWQFFESPINQLKRLFPYRANGLRSRVEMPLRAAKGE
jgi:peptidoglycan/LPS O-acetylase OafA/YrhL